MSLRILLVDDDVSLLESLEASLADDGYTVNTALDAENALDQLNTTTPDAIVSDCNMPGMQGPEFIKIVRTREPTADVPVIMMTGATVQPQIPEANAILAKPFDYRNLAALLEFLTGSPRQRAAS